MGPPSAYTYISTLLYGWCCISAYPARSIMLNSGLRVGWFRRRTETQDECLVSLEPAPVNACPSCHRGRYLTHAAFSPGTQEPPRWRDNTPIYPRTSLSIDDWGQRAKEAVTYWFTGQAKSPSTRTSASMGSFKVSILREELPELLPVRERLDPLTGNALAARHIANDMC